MGRVFVRATRDEAAARRVREDQERKGATKGPRFPWAVDDRRWREMKERQRGREAERQSERDVSQEETKGFGSTYQPEVVTSSELRG